MKKTVLIALAVLLFVNCYAQDVIIMKNGDDLKVKVLEITQKEVRYKRFDNIDGPIIEIPKTGIFMIRYENGTKELIESNAVEPTTTIPPKYDNLKQMLATHNRVFIQSFDEYTEQAFRNVIVEEKKTWKIVSKKESADFIIDLRFGEDGNRDFSGTAEIIDPYTRKIVHKTPKFSSHAVRDIQGKRKLARQIIDYLITLQ